MTIRYSAIPGKGQSSGPAGKSVERHLKMAQAFGVLGKPAVQRVGHSLTVIRLLEQDLFARVADETDLRQHGRHVGADQHDERGLLHAAVSLPRKVSR